MNYLSSRSCGSWVRVPSPLSTARLRLICLPHAGAGASTYYRWREALRRVGVDLAAVQYPGREDRMSDPPITSFDQMVTAIVGAWEEIAGSTRCMLLGHSLGAALGFEVVLELSRRGCRNLPQQLFVSGRNPPHVKRTRRNIADLPDDEFIRSLLIDYPASLPPEILEHPEMLRIVTRVLRWDIATNESYGGGVRPSLSMPITVFGGYDDPWTSAESLAEWQRYSSHRCSVHMFPGGHFFHHTASSEVLKTLIAALDLPPIL